MHRCSAPIRGALSGAQDGVSGVPVDPARWRPRGVPLIPRFRPFIGPDWPTAAGRATLRLAGTVTFTHIPMTRRIFGLVTLGMGTLQAWDARAFDAGPSVALLAAGGVLAAGLPLLASPRPRAWLGGVVGSAVLLLAARLVAPFPLNTLHLVSFIGALSALASHRFGQRRASAA